MPLILHLSDLHLAGLDGDDVFGDHKIDVVRQRDRQGRTQLIRSSLRALGSALRRAGKALDAIVVSGDITDRGDPAGFRLLPPTLGELAGSLPSPDRVMVVPGNHDVTWYTEPSTQARYENFLDGVRAHGYATPLLEGIDIGPDGALLPDTAAAPLLSLAEGAVVILGLNSANYCGVEEQPPPEVASAIAELDEQFGDNPAYHRLRESWRRRGAFDVARLGKEQRRYGAELLDGLPQQPAVRIATMHHQLLPVGFDEEVKPFESLLNLATTRAFLADHQIDVLLHGHKHIAGLYRDTPQARHGGTTRSLVVCSARTVGKGQTSDGEIAKLVFVDVRLPTVHHVGFQSVPSCDDGAPMPQSVLSPHKNFALGGGDVDHGVFSGATAAAVHEQLVSIFPDSEADLPRPVLCRVADGQSARRLPPTFPQISGHESHNSRQQWFTEMAQQWQHREPGPGLDFNHGQRLRGYWRGVDQINRVANVLAQRGGSSRGVAVLIDPTTDPIEDHTARFPAFVLAQFFIRDDALHVIAYFRKQEMRFWWAINVAELAMLQSTIMDELAQKSLHVHAGTLSTITAIPTTAASLPKVAIPVIDRIAAEDISSIIRHSIPLITPGEAAGQESQRWWNALFDDWYPAHKPVPDGDPAPVFGLRTVADTLAAIATAYDATERLRELTERLRRLAEGNQHYIELLHQSAASQQRPEWAARTRADIHRVRTTITELLGAPRDC
ncbi:metallophosphoesterase [Amycolatopsis lurida]